MLEIKIYTSGFFKEAAADFINNIELISKFPNRDFATVFYKMKNPLKVLYLCMVGAITILAAYILFIYNGGANIKKSIPARNPYAAKGKKIYLIHSAIRLHE